MFKKLFTLVLIILSGVAYGNESVTKSKEIKFSGVVYSKNKIGLSAEVSGEVLSILNTGTEYKKGDVLVNIDKKNDKELRDSILKEIGYIEKSILLLKTQVKRYEKFKIKGSVSIQDYENKSLELYKLQRDFQDLKRAAIRINNTIKKKTIVAKSEGVVLSSFYKEGEYANVESILLELLDTNVSYIMVKVPVKQIDDISKGNAFAQFNREENVRLVIDYIGVTVDEKANTVDVSYKVISEKYFKLGEKGIVSIRMN